MAGEKPQYDALPMHFGMNLASAIGGEEIRRHREGGSGPKRTHAAVIASPCGAEANAAPARRLRDGQR